MVRKDLVIQRNIESYLRKSQAFQYLEGKSRLRHTLLIRKNKKPYKQTT